MGGGGTALGRDGGKGEGKREMRTFARSRGARVQFIIINILQIIIYLAESQL